MKTTLSKCLIIVITLAVPWNQENVHTFDKLFVIIFEMFEVYANIGASHVSKRIKQSICIFRMIDIHGMNCKKRIFSNVAKKKIIHPTYVKELSLLQKKKLNIIKWFDIFSHENDHSVGFSMKQDHWNSYCSWCHRNFQIQS